MMTHLETLLRDDVGFFDKKVSYEFVLSILSLSLQKKKELDSYLEDPYLS